VGRMTIGQTNEMGKEKLRKKGREVQLLQFREVKLES
jgi:hypothetical protein